MQENQKSIETKNPVVKALIASYKKLVALPIKDEKRPRRRVYASTNSRVRRTEIASSRVKEDD